MKNYERPVMIRTEELAEGVYLASGGIKCDSVYMNGVWQAPDYSDWNGTTRGYKQQFGCLGCPANTASGCGLLSHYVDSGYAGSTMWIMVTVSRHGRRRAMARMMRSQTGTCNNL